MHKPTKIKKQIIQQIEIPASHPSHLGMNPWGQWQQCPLEISVSRQGVDSCPSNHAWTIDNQNPECHPPLEGKRKAVIKSVTMI